MRSTCAGSTKAVEADKRDQPRKDREQAVERNTGGNDREPVALDLVLDALGDVQPAAGGNLLRPVGASSARRLGGRRHYQAPFLSGPVAVGPGADAALALARSAAACCVEVAAVERLVSAALPSPSLFGDLFHRVLRFFQLLRAGFLRFLHEIAARFAHQRCFLLRAGRHGGEIAPTARPIAPKRERLLAHKVINAAARAVPLMRADSVTWPARSRMEYMPLETRSLAEARLSRRFAWRRLPCPASHSAVSQPGGLDVEP